MVNQGEHQSWALKCGPILLTWCRRQYELKQCGSPASRAPKMSNKKFIEEVVDTHNDYRKKHGVSSLKHSKELSSIAQKWADQLAATNSFQHSQSSHKGERLGENIAMKWSPRPETYTGKDVTDQWYSEISMYQFGGEPRSNQAGHFSQVVWKDSKEIGVGKAQASDGKIIVVANYKPAGNFLGRYSENVLPPTSGRVVLPAKPAESSQPERYTSGPASKFPSHTSSSHSNSRNPDHSSMNSSGAKSVRTYTSREGSGPNAVTKTIVEETVTMPDGRKVTTKKETVTTGGSSERATMGNDFGDFDKEFSSSFDRLKFGDDDRSTFSQGFSRGDLGGNRFNGNSSTQPKSESRSQPSSSQSKPQTMSAFTKDSLSAHNGLRAKHGAPPLTQSRDLTDYAQRWAEHLASTGSFQHSDCTLKNGDRLGENIACKWSSGGDDYTGQAVTDQWYSEIKKYDFSGRSRSSGTGHFTQVVWKGSRELGMGKARGRDGKVIVVASYRPAGNMLGTYQDNVFPPK